MDVSTISFTSLPEDCLLKILEYCDVKSLCRLAQTCKILKHLCDSEVLWEKPSSLVLGSNLLSKPMQNRSKPDLGYKKRCEIGSKWKSKRYRKPVTLKYIRCLPWICLEKNSLFCAIGCFMFQFHRDNDGDIDLNKYNRYRPHNDDISKFVINGDEIVSGGRDGTLVRRRISMGKSISVINAHPQDLNCVDAKGNLVISGSKDHFIKVWKSEGNSTLLEKEINMNTRVLSVAILPCNSQCVIGLPGIDVHPLQLFDIERGQKISSFGTTYQRGAGILDIYPEYNNTFLSCGYDCTVRLWDKRCPENCVATWTDPYDNSIYTVRSDNNVTLVSGASRFGIVHIWDKRCCKCQFMHFFSRDNSPTYSVAFDACHLYAALDKFIFECSYL